MPSGSILPTFLLTQGKNFERYSSAKGVHMKLYQIMFQRVCTIFSDWFNHITVYRCWVHRFIVICIASRNVEIEVERVVPFSPPEQLLCLLRLRIVVSISI